jgi:type I restriction enzyme S subunit
MGNIQDGRLDWSSLVFTQDKVEAEKYRLTSGDVLFNRTNSPELVGKSAVFKGERDAIYAGYLIRVKCFKLLLPDYLNYCLGSPAGRNYCWQVKSDGVSQSNINAQKLAAFEFLLPPVAEQTEIVRRVESLFTFADRLEARLTLARTAAERLTPALLAKAFRGELVPQDPDDEPAAELLKRLAAGTLQNSAKRTRRSSTAGAAPAPTVEVPTLRP